MIENRMLIDSEWEDIEREEEEEDYIEGSDYRMGEY